jgi:hypothetical protein
MMDQLQVFSSEVSRVAREVGTEGTLVGQAQIIGVDGTWKELIKNGKLPSLQAVGIAVICSRNASRSSSLNFVKFWVPCVEGLSLEVSKDVISCCLAADDLDDRDGVFSPKGEERADSFEVSGREKKIQYWTYVTH